MVKKQLLCQELNWVEDLQSPSKIVNYTQGGVLGDVAVEPDPVTGIITIPKNGVYKIVSYVYGLQPSVTQNETMAKAAPSRQIHDAL